MPKLDEKPVKTPKAPKAQNECGCGCGGLTFNRFLPGHDAKLKSQLLKRAADGDESAIKELTDLGWLKFHESRAAKTERRALAKANRDAAAAERATEREQVKAAKQAEKAAAKAEAARIAAESKANAPADAEVTPKPGAKLNRAERQQRNLPSNVRSGK